jgi:hypothetical protein
MAIKNAYTKSALEDIISAIQKVLVAHNAQKIQYDYENGVIVGMTFGIMVGDKLIGVKMPAKVKEAEMILREQGLFNPTKKDHALRVAWANIRDWVDSQMAMIDLGQVKMAQAFLGYVLDGDKTVYEIYEQKFISLPESK